MIGIRNDPRIEIVGIIMGHIFAGLLNNWKNYLSSSTLTDCFDTYLVKICAVLFLSASSIAYFSPAMSSQSAFTPASSIVGFIEIGVFISLLLNGN